MKRIAVAVSLAFALSGCDQITIQSGQKLATRDLADPSSAQFRDLIVRDGNVCGQMNGKNRLGAYVGFKGFIARTDSGAVIHEPYEEPDIAFDRAGASINRMSRDGELVQFDALSQSLCGRRVGSADVGQALDRGDKLVRDVLARP